MKNLLVFITAVLLSTAAITPVLATPGVVCGQACQVIVTIDDQPAIDLSKFIVADSSTGLFGFLPAVTSFSIPDLAFGTVGVTINPDPFVIFSLSGTNLTGAAQFWSLHVSTPINLNGTINASSSIAYTLTDNGNGTVSLTASPNSHVAVFTDLAPLINKGVDVGPTVIATTVASPPCSALTGGTATCGPFTATNTFTTSGPVTTMNVDIGLFISGNDGFSLSGRVDQNQGQGSTVPEPASLLLIGTGLVALAGWRRYFSRG